MAQDSVYADLLDSLSPLTTAGIDPDEARMDRAGTMAKLLGDDDPEPQQSWSAKAKADYDAQQSATTPTPGDASPQVSPNGNPMPAGLQSRVPQPTRTPTIPASVAPSGNATTPSLADRNSKSIGIMEDNLARASQDVQNEAAQPSEEEQTRVLEQQRVNAQRRQVDLETPLDPQTGKTRPEYKPSFGQRLMRGVEGFAGGGVLGVVDPRVGGAPAYGAPNKEYGYDKRQAADRVAGADQQLTRAAANWKARNDQLKAIAQERRAVATTGKDVTGASIAQQEVPIKKEEADNSSPEAARQKLQDQFTQVQAKADKMGLKGQQRTLFLANGKLPDPRQATSEDIGRAQATAAWHRDNPGKQPSLDDIRSINAAVSGSEIKGTVKNGKPIPPALQNKILDEKKAAMDAATASYRDGMDKSGQPFKQSDWVNAMQSAQDKFEAAIEAEGGTTNHMTVNSDGSWTAQKAADKDSQPNTPTSEMQPNEVYVIAPDGTPGYISSDKLDKALKRGYQQPGRIPGAK